MKVREDSRQYETNVQETGSYALFLFNPLRTSMGTGKMMVEFFSQEMELSVWRYLSCMAAWLPEMLSLAALRATLAVFSPSAAIT